MFVYPYDPPTSTTKSHLSWLVQNFDCKDPFNWRSCTDSLPAKRIRIKGKDRFPPLKKLLAEKYHLTPDTIYEPGAKIRLSSP